MSLATSPYTCFEGGKRLYAQLAALIAGGVFIGKRLRSAPRPDDTFVHHSKATVEPQILKCFAIITKLWLGKAFNRFLIQTSIPILFTAPMVPGASETINQEVRP